MLYFQIAFAIGYVNLSSKFGRHNHPSPVHLVEKPGRLRAEHKARNLSSN